MNYELKPYPEYKDSGVPWLGEIPVHWNALPSRALFVEVKERGFPDKQMLSVTITQGVIPQSDLLASSSKKDSSNEDKSNYKLVCPDDIAYNKMRAWQGAVGVSQYHGIVSPAYVVVRPRGKQNTKYFHYLLRTPAFTKEAERWSYGITSDQWSLRPSEFKQIYCCTPPLNEQSAIARFLDHTDRRIRRYIRAKQKLIALLNEQKQAIIHRAVTRGLDPTVRLKPSGVEWLGEVPEHWEVVRVKQCARTISKGTTPSTEGREILELGPVRFLKAENIAGGRVVEKPSCFIDEETNNVLRRSQLSEDDVLFVIAGATLGKVAVVEKDVLPANINQAVAFVRPNKLIVTNYLALWLQSPHVKELTWLNAVQSAQPNLSMTDLGSFPVPLPPVREQHDILLGLRNVCLGIEEVIHRTERQIALLREYRTRLIADVVTGKLDVREVAAKLPDEAVEPEALNDVEALAEGDDAAEDEDLDAATEDGNED